MATACAVVKDVNIDSKPVEKLVKAAISRDTNLMVKEDTTYQLAKFSRMKSADDISRAVICGDISVSDIAILKAVCDLGQANPESIKVHLEIVKRLYPDLLILQSGVDSVRARLQELSMLGCLFAQEVIFGNGRKMILYSCTEAGVTLIRKQTGKHIYYERFINVENRCDMFRRVAGGYIGVVLASNMNCVEYHGPHYNDTFKLNTSKDPYFHSLFTRENEDGVYVDHIVTSLYFEMDKGLLIKDDRIEFYKSQLILFEDWANANKKTRNRDTKFIICVENLAGMQNAFKLVRETIPHAAELCYYTSESVIHEMRGNERKSFFKADGKQGKFTVVDITEE